MNQTTVTVALCCLITINLSGEPNQSAKVAQKKGESQPTVTTTFVDNSAGPPNATRPENSSPNWYASPEWWLVIMAFPTLLFLGWQSWETRKSARAAQVALVLAQRPRLEVRNLVIVNPDIANRSESFVGAYFDVVNAGGTAAIVIQSHCMNWNGANLPMKRPFEELAENNPIEVAARIEPGATQRGNFTISTMDLSVARHMAANPKGFIQIHPLYVMGFIKYRDTLGICRETVFCRQYDTIKQRFFAVIDPDYEYTD